MHIAPKTAAPLLLLLVPALSACAHAVSPVATIAPCAVAAESSEAIRWLAPSSPHDLARSRSGCGSVGPATVRRVKPGRPRHDRGTIFVVSWNVAVGSGRVQSLTRDLTQQERQAGRPEPDFILLLQEARRVDSPPTAAYDGVAATPVSREDVLSVATELRMSVAYIPSMPNRTPEPQHVDDRGNAILSTLPLRDITALELPFVRQRRVAVIARVDVDGRSLTVISLHLDTRRPLLKGSIFSGPIARGRQAAAILQALEPLRADGPIVIGGDFNTVGGVDEPALRSMKEQYPRIVCGSPITHKWGFALDHLFASDRSLLNDCGRIRQRYGSDHHPLVARLSADDE
jgi:endonuclease/exonuclease/phosphatase family metal-dependent hydrolase